MKILAIGRNYTEHIEELNNEKPDQPVVFFKPDSAILRNNAAFYYPDFSNDIHYEVEIVLRICKVGKYIQKEFCHEYFDAICLGVDFTARDLQQKAKEKGLPWTLAKGFDGSAPISEFIPKEEINDLGNLNFELKVDGNTVQKGNTGLMLYNVEEIITYISKYITLKKGDLIFTGTPKGVGPVQVGNRLQGYIEGKKMLDFEVR